MNIRHFFELQRAFKSDRHVHGAADKKRIAHGAVCGGDCFDLVAGI